jgi:transcription factor TGA
LIFFLSFHVWILSGCRESSANDLKLKSPKTMNSPSAQFVATRRIGGYEPMHQISTWGENFKSNGNLNSSSSLILEDTKLDNQSEDASHDTLEPLNQYDQEASKPVDKVLRRLAQNREAARKSRLRKKAYVQQLETSRLKLIQLEQELERARHQGFIINGGLDAGHLGFSGTVNSGLFVNILAEIIFGSNLLVLKCCLVLLILHAFKIQ